MVAAFIPVLAFHYIYFYDKVLWQNFEDEFKEESKSERIRGNILITTYVLGSIFLGAPIMAFLDFLREMILRMV